MKQLIIINSISCLVIIAGICTAFASETNTGFILITLGSSGVAVGSLNYAKKFIKRTS